MRTTITLDPDVESLIDKFRRDRGLTFKEAVNAAIRAGLTPRDNTPFRQRTFDMGVRPGINYDKVLQIDAAIDSEERLRKLAIGG